MYVRVAALAPPLRAAILQTILYFSHGLGFFHFIFSSNILGKSNADLIRIEKCVSDMQISGGISHIIAEPYVADYHGFKYYNQSTTIMLTSQLILSAGIII